ncbi:efflux RND transporter periplasmic adaptor subunit [Antribacter gilvus]|uniref:efflux RND transporter periplasmic adaptor subunit n=1 Tax=Antribacter gilvus TaxID=2304675 RepID=UPI000F7A289F|nr:secretion protein HlyD [Antribacter gilvus]
MGITRQYVFPILRLVVWAVIAAALVKIAFTGADLEPPDALQPTGEITDSIIEVSTATVTNSVVVPASVVADAPVEVKATAVGKVSEIVAADGAVGVDAEVLRVRLEEPREPLVKTDPTTGEQTMTERKPKITVTTIKAPIGGTLDVTVLKDQEVSVGDTIGTITPGSLSVSGTLTAEQQYRLVGAAGEAQVTLKGGPAPFTCTGLTIGSAAPGAGADPGADPNATTTGAVRCAIPGGVTAFPGLGAEIEIVNGNAEDAVVVPVSAVLGSSQTGKVWVVADEGAEPEEREIKLGLTDGSKIQVTEGLAAGDMILEFTPLADKTEGGPDCDDPSAYEKLTINGDLEAAQAYQEACFG